MSCQNFRSRGEILPGNAIDLCHRWARDDDYRKTKATSDSQRRHKLDFLSLNRSVMRHIWPVLYFVGLASAAYSGYSQLQPHNTAKTNGDWIFVAVSFVISVAAPILAVAVARNRGVEVFRRPSLTRQPFGWWSDTLQPIRLVLIGFLCAGAGAAFALKNTDPQGVMLFYWFAAMALGWFIGERIAYAWLRDRVVASAECVPPPGSLEPRIFYLLGVVSFITGYVSTTSDRLIIWLNESQRILLRAERPAIFVSLTVGLFAIGTVFFAIGFLCARRRSTG